MKKNNMMLVAAVSAVIGISSTANAFDIHHLINHADTNALFESNQNNFAAVEAETEADYLEYDVEVEFNEVDDATFSISSTAVGNSLSLNVIDNDIQPIQNVSAAAMINQNNHGYIYADTEVEDIEELEVEFDDINNATFSISSTAVGNSVSVNVGDANL